MCVLYDVILTRPVFRLSLNFVVKYHVRSTNKNPILRSTYSKTPGSNNTILVWSFINTDLGLKQPRGQSGGGTFGTRYIQRT